MKGKKDKNDGLDGVRKALRNIANHKPETQLHSSSKKPSAADLRRKWAIIDGLVQEVVDEAEKS